MLRSTSIVLVALTAGPAWPQSGLRVEIDAGQPQAALRDLRGVNKAPTFDAHTPGVRYDGQSLYRSFGVSQARLHDSGGDLCTIYKSASRLNMGVTPPATVPGCTLSGTGSVPHFMWTPSSSADAELNNPDNYDFTSLDDALARTIASGAKVYLGLAQNFNGPNDTTDPVAWAKVATNIYRHVIGDFKPTAGIAVDPVFVEIHNEPDGGSWRGDLATFDTLYVENTSRVRAAAAAAGRPVRVGGAGFTRNVVSNSRQAGNPANGFIANVGAGSLDFYSAHLYDQCATATLSRSASDLRALRALVDGQGGAGKPLQISEWNIGLGTQCGNDFFSDPRLQSYASGVLTLMQDPAQAIEAAHFYAGVTVMALFDFTTVAGAVRVNPSAWALWAHARLDGMTGLSTQVCPSGGSCVAGYAADTAPVLALGGRAGGRLAAVVTNDGTGSQTYTLRFKGLTGSVASALVRTPPQAARDIAAGGTPVAADATALAGLLASVTSEQRPNLVVAGGQTELSLSIPAHGVQVVELWPSSALVPVSTTQLDCLLDWGESAYPELLTPAHAGTQTATPYTYRYYAATNTYVGVSSADQHLFVLPASQTTSPLDLGPAMTWVIQARCL